MASTFDVFRRYQKVLFVVFIAIMLAFILSDANIFSLFRDRDGVARSSADTMVTWKHGRVSETEMYTSLQRHFKMQEFLRGVIEATLKKNGSPKVPNVNVRSLEDLGQLERTGYGLARANSPVDYFQKMLLARKAAEMGIVVNDKSVHDFLEKLSDKTLSGNELGKIMSATVGAKAAFSPQQIFDQLRLELAAQSMLVLANSSFGVTTPGEAWDYYNRTSRRVTAEVFPLKVDDYKEKVDKKPTDQELRDLFEKHKYNTADKNSPLPGFHKRKQVAFEYFKVVFDTFLQDELPKITDEQIQKEYELAISRGEFKVQELPPSSPDATPKTEPAKTEPEGSKDETKKEEPKKEAPKKEDGTKKEDTQKTEAPALNPPTPSTEPKTDEKKAPAKDDKPAAKETKADPPKTEAKKEEEKKPDDKKDAEKKSDGASIPRSGEFFVNLEEQQADDAKKEDTKKEDAAKAEATKDAPKPEATKTEPAKTEPAKSDEKKEPEKKETKADDKPKFKPLEEVREEIRKRLAKPGAEAARKAAIETARKEVERYGRKRREWDTFKNEGKLEKPEQDFEGLAKRLKLTFGATELLDETQIETHELGGNNPWLIRFQGYHQELTRYIVQTPSVQTDTDFLWWKVDEKKEETPTFAEANEQVIEAWKKKQALEIAKKDAEKKAEEARGKASLKEVFGAGATETGEFSWIQYDQWSMMNGMGPQISTVDGVEAPSPEFMERVFSLKSGEVGYAVNASESIVYIVRVAKESSSDTERRDRFIQTGFTFPLRGMAMQDSRNALVQWYSDVEKEMGVSWNQTRNGRRDD